MSTQINVKCIDQTLALVSTPLIASGGVNEDVVNFTFCQKWDGFSKTAVFYRKPEDVYYSLIDSDNACVIPQEVLKEDGYLYFGVFGSNANGVIRTSEVLKYKIEKGAITENIKPSDPTPSIYEQLLTKYQEILELCEDTATAESEFETLITNKQNAFETSINNQFNTYKEETNAKFNDKVSITDIVDNLTSTDTDKPLSAKQGKVLKEAIDNKTFPVDTSMSDTSTNAVQNKVIKKYVDDNTGSKATVRSNITVSVTPVAMSSYMAWDTEEVYGYKATITISGLTENSLIENLVMSDTLLASVGYIATTGTNSLTFYTQDDTVLDGTIITLVTSEVE